MECSWLTDGFCGVLAGIIDSRSSVHRPPNSAKGVYTGAGQGSIQHDLELLAVVRLSGLVMCVLVLDVPRKAVGGVPSDTSPRACGFQYKQLGREEDRALASYTSPYQFEDDAVDGEVSASKVR